MTEFHVSWCKYCMWMFSLAAWLTSRNRNHDCTPLLALTRSFTCYAGGGDHWATATAPATGRAHHKWPRVHRLLQGPRDHVQVSGLGWSSGFLSVAQVVEVDSVAYHSWAVTVVAALDLRTRFMSFAITSLAGGLNVHCDFLIHTFGSLCKRQLHHILIRNTQNRLGA